MIGDMTGETEMVDDEVMGEKYVSYLYRLLSELRCRPTKILPSGHVAVSHSNVENTMNVLIHRSNS